MKLIPENQWKKEINSLKVKEKKVDRELLKKQLINAVKKRIPGKKFGILFSGGVDSSFIAMICKDLKANFVCYSVGFKEKLIQTPKDIVYAKKVAKSLGVKLKIKIIDLKEAEKVIEKTAGIVPVNIVNIGVGSVVFACLEMAKKDKIDVLFSGLGSEEIFAGYERHEKAKDINQECWNGLMQMWQRDLVRDYALANYFNVKIETPFLDKELIKTAMQIPSKYKIKGEIKKVILREIAEQLGLKKEFAWRKKSAAQYGSNFNKAIKKLTKKHGFEYQKDYLKKLEKPMLGALFSGGKDSSYAIYLMQKKGFNVKCLISMKSKNPDSYMFHTPAIDLVELQAKAMEIPLILGHTKGEKEKELKDLEKLLKKAKKECKIEGIITGALYSNYQKQRIEKICEKLKLKCFSPLWHIDQEKYMRKLIKDGFEVILTAIAADGLDRTWLGKKLTEKDVDKLVEINEKIGINVAGEGGEFESLVVNCPLFSGRIEIEKFDIVSESKNVARLVVGKVTLL